MVWLRRNRKPKRRKIYITNAKIVLPDKIIRGALVIRGRRIAAVQQKGRIPRGVNKINVRGDFLAPGFIDLHIHGDVKGVSRQQIKGGTTGFLATLHPAKPKTLLEDIGRVLRQRRGLRGAKVLGLRLEGPFLNSKFSGALPVKYLRPPDINEAKRIVQKAPGALKIVILAPELKGALNLIRLLKRHKVVPSLGHSGATYEEAQRGIKAGIIHATHTFNRMRGFNHRSPGALGAVLTDSRVACEVIADGVHAHPAALKLLFACKGLDRLMLVTDSTAAQRYPDKKRSGSVFRLKNGTLYGTALTLNKALKKAIKFWGLSLSEAVRLVTLNPAKLLKIDRRKGSLAVGKDADIVVFDKNFNVKLTAVEGKIVYNNRCLILRQLPKT